MSEAIKTDLETELALRLFERNATDIKLRIQECEQIATEVSLRSVLKAKYQQNAVAVDLLLPLADFNEVGVGGFADLIIENAEYQVEKLEIAKAQEKYWREEKKRREKLKRKKKWREFFAEHPLIGA